jgi:hypothetical protein
LSFVELVGSPMSRARTDGTAASHWYHGRVFHATGNRVREQPIRLEKLLDV